MNVSYISKTQLNKVPTFNKFNIADLKANIEELEGLTGESANLPVNPSFQELIKAYEDLESVLKSQL